MSAVVLALCNQKGGVGKTTTTYHLARSAVAAGQKVLAIDMDPQANLTMIAAAEDVDADALSIADVLSPRVGERLAEVLVPGAWPGLTLAPAVDTALANVRDELVGVPVGRESRLRQALQEISGDYDLVLIDCPPELGQLTINALVAATRAAVVTEARLFAAQGTAGIMGTIDTVREHYNPTLRFAGVIVNKHEHTITSRERLDELAGAVRVIDPVIPKRVAINDAAEAATGLDEWPREGPELATLYRTILQQITQEDT
ncbi:ParA family protein [Ornithinimicrobium sp. LYQ92]|uniref:ParA family protein n=1 Tax=Serinicoccus sp. LYQ92 TaxID=3378798 RepID=UPI00385222E7